MKSGSSAFISSGGQSALTPSSASWSQMVGAFVPWHVAAGAPDNQNLLAAGALLERFVGVDLERDLTAATDAFVGGDDEGRLAVDDAAGKRVW